MLPLRPVALGLKLTIYKIRCFRGLVHHVVEHKRPNLNVLACSIGDVTLINAPQPAFPYAKKHEAITCITCLGFVERNRCV